jgi:hypothetical protein
VQSVMALATNSGSRHEVLIANESTPASTVNEKIRDFFVQSTNWKAPKTQGVEAIQKLLENKVK